MHAIIRFASQDLHPFEVAFFRNVFGFLILTPFFLRQGAGVFKTHRFPLHCLRGLLQTGAMLMFFYALTITPLAKTSALSFTSPLFASLGAIVILGERLRLRRTLALVFGFLGALIILRPGVESLQQGALLVVASSLLWSLAMLVIKALSRTDSSVTLTAYMGIVMVPLSLLPALTVWSWPASVRTWLLLVVLGSVGGLSQLAMAEAFRRADATVVLPFDFTRLVWASLLGYVLFSEVPEIWTWLGGGLIFASTTYLAYREARSERKRQDPLSLGAA
jgi:drug/metabolite transporter (DMT)-like permease